MIAYKETSREAYDSFEPISGHLDRLIMAEIERAGEQGITCEQIEQRIGRKHQAVSGNLRHLAERGFVCDSGRRGVVTSGRNAILWVAKKGYSKQMGLFKED